MAGIAAPTPTAVMGVLNKWEAGDPRDVELTQEAIAAVASVVGAHIGEPGYASIVQGIFLLGARS